MNKEAEQTYKYFQERSYVTMDYDSEQGGTSISTSAHHQRIYPTHFDKDRMQDYLPGPVKIYTKQEILEYERDRDDH